MDLHALIKKIETTQLRKNVPDVRAGETVRVHYKIREGNKERIQVFEGLVIACKGGSSLQGSFTVRKVVSGVGIERTFPLHSPWIVKIERVKSGKVRRSKLYFVRRHAQSPKRFRLKDKGIAGSTWEEVGAKEAEVTPEEAVSQEPEIEETEKAETPAEESLQSGETEANSADVEAEDSSEDKGEQA